jgi:hypothetical protein
MRTIVRQWLLTQLVRFLRTIIHAFDWFTNDSLAWIDGQDLGQDGLRSQGLKNMTCLFGGLDMPAKQRFIIVHRLQPVIVEQEFHQTVFTMESLSIS